MYHHIHKYSSKFHSLHFDKFKRQINFLRKNYNILTPAEFYKKLKKKKFNKKDCVLTFDDGYTSQYNLAYKFLNKFNIKAFYFPITSQIQKSDLHLINKVQLICNCSKDKQKILDEIQKNIDQKKFKVLHENLKKTNKRSPSYDDATTSLIKNLLQKSLSHKIRNKIVKVLFEKYVPDTKKNKHFYMNLKQLLKLKKDGNEIGLHSHNHYWLSSLSKQKQQEEIKKSYNYLLKKKLINKTQWSFCYPFGDYNKDTIKILNKMNCNAAFSFGNQLTNTKSKPLIIKRLDCNMIFPIKKI